MVLFPLSFDPLWPRERPYLPISGRRDHETLLVNDGSTDRTWETILDLRPKYANIVGVDFAYNPGHQLARTWSFACQRRGSPILTKPSPPSRGGCRALDAIHLQIRSLLSKEALTAASYTHSPRKIDLARFGRRCCIGGGDALTGRQPGAEFISVACLTDLGTMVLKKKIIWRPFALQMQLCKENLALRVRRDVPSDVISTKRISCSRPRRRRRRQTTRVSDREKGLVRLAEFMKTVL
jgi:glycosyltransferase involved in cell wall biosynthesis